MPKSNPSEKELLKNLLKPLLEDFEYWFSRSINFLEKEEIDFLSIEEKTDLLNRVQAARNEVSVAQMLFTATDEQVGIEASTMLQWHKLVSECWQVAMRWRQSSGFKIEE